ncbi:MAG: FAD-dependent tricarballylate dehydrogenase TcuA [Burkholderiales bacterium]
MSTGNPVAAGNAADVIVVGRGNAALCAALAAHEQGATVLILEVALEEESGGNSRYAGGLMRFAYDSVEDLRQLMAINEEEAANTDWDSNTRDQFYDDMYSSTNFRTDPDLSELLVTRSFPTMVWLRSQGVRFVPTYQNSVVIDGRRIFSGRMPLQINGGGAGLVEFLSSAAVKKGIPSLYGTRAVGLVYDGEKVQGVKVKSGGTTHEIRATSVVLACGGFEANPEWRARYLGPGWDLAKVRGTRFNVGDGLKMALDIGAAPFGHWSGAHAISWDLDAPDMGDTTVSHEAHRHCFPWSLMINAEGKRFVDEGAEFYGYTYAKYGAEILKQPGQFAWQVFDGKVTNLLWAEYWKKRVKRVSAQSLEGLAAKLEGVDPKGFLDTVAKYNASIRKDIPFDPSRKDGRCTEGINPRKSNWANTLDTPPFEAFGVACGITFTYGGLRTRPPTGEVVDVSGNAIPGLYTGGEMLGGLFYTNYPAAAGLVAGAVFGKIAGDAAGKRAREISKH